MNSTSCVTVQPWPTPYGSSTILSALQICFGTKYTGFSFGVEAHSAAAIHFLSCTFGSSYLHQDAISAEKPAPRKREVAQPRPGFLLEDVKMETITPIPYDIIKEGLQQ